MLVRIPPKRWGMLVRILPNQVGKARENTWVMLVGNDKNAALERTVGSPGPDKKRFSNDQR